MFPSTETGMSGNFVGRIKGAKCPFDLQFLPWDFSRDAVAGKVKVAWTEKLKAGSSVWR